MKNFRLILVGLSVVFYLLKNFWHYSPLYVNIMNDILAIPFFLMVMEFLMRKIYGHAFRLNFGYVLLTVVVVSILFEWTFPMLSKKNTADLLDVLWYTIGGIAYSIFQLFENSKKLVNQWNIGDAD